MQRWLKNCVDDFDHTNDDVNRIVHQCHILDECCGPRCVICDLSSYCELECCSNLICARCAFKCLTCNINMCTTCSITGYCSHECKLSVPSDRFLWGSSFRLENEQKLADAAGNFTVYDFPRSRYVKTLFKPFRQAVPVQLEGCQAIRPLREYLSGGMVDLRKLRIHTQIVFRAKTNIRSNELAHGTLNRPQQRFLIVDSRYCTETQSYILLATIFVQN